MIQTVLVYSILTIIMYLLCKKADENCSWKYVVCALVIYSLVFGFRYGVGFDYFSYIGMYQDVLNNNPIRDVEIGYLYLMKLSALLKLPKEGFMIVTSFIPIYFTFRVLKDELYICKFLVLSFMLTAVWLSYMNGIRQIIAIGFWIFSMKYIVEKKIVKHYLLIFSAILFHNSAAVLLLFYPLVNYRKEWINNIALQLVLLVISLILMRLTFVQSIISNLEYILNISGYGWYVDNASQKLIQEEQSILGIGFYLNLARVIFLIYLSPKVKEWANSDLFVIIYNFFFLGVIITYLLWGSHLIDRLNWYFSLTSTIIGAYTLAYCYSNLSKYFSLILFVFFIMTFVATMYKAIGNTSFFVFTWQQELYQFKSFLIR